MWLVRLVPTPGPHVLTAVYRWRPCGARAEVVIRRCAGGLSPLHAYSLVQLEAERPRVPMCRCVPIHHLARHAAHPCYRLTKPRSVGRLRSAEVEREEE